MMQGSYGLYWGNLSKTLDETRVFDLCAQQGVHPMYVKVFRGKTSGESLGSAFVLFLSQADAERITKTLNNAVIDGHAIRIMPYAQNFKESLNGKTCIVIYHLPTTVSQKDLNTLCAAFGDVKSCYIPADVAGQPTGVGFVMFATEAEKEQAIAKLNNTSIKTGDVPLKVFPYFSKAERIVHRYTKGTYNNLYVKGIPKEGLSEADLKDIFGKYGELLSVILKKDPLNEKLNSGAAYVCFKNNADAMKAKEELHGKEVKGAKLHVDRHYKKSQMAELKQAQKAIAKEEWNAKYAECNLFVKPIPGKVQQSDIESIFKIYGKIVSVKIASKWVQEEGKAPTKKSRHFAFVCFSNKEEAKRAQADADGKFVWGRKMYVNFAQAKDVRERELKKTSAEAARPLPVPGYVPYPYPVPQLPVPAPIPKPMETKKPVPAVPTMAAVAAAAEQKEEENPYYIDRKYIKKAGPEEKKHYLGEKLYMIVSEKEPQLASKITGKILELNVEEILALFDETHITEKIAELKKLFEEGTKVAHA